METVSPSDLLSTLQMPKRLAVLDLGSTSFSLVVVDVAADGDLVRVLRKRSTLRLGAHTNDAGAIPEEDCLRAIEAVRRLRAKADRAGCDTLFPVGTAILRDASNARELTSSISDVLGQPVRILSGEEEARLSYTAIQRRLELAGTQILAADLGGGSLELAAGIDRHPQWMTSLPIGVTRLHAEWVHSDPPSAAEVLAIQDHVRERLEPRRPELSESSRARFVATGGTIRALARLALAWRSPTDRSELNGMILARKELEKVLARLMRASNEQRLAMPTVQSRRADLLPAGALIVDTLMIALGLDELTVCDWGLREGVLLEALAKPGGADRGSS